MTLCFDHNSLSSGLSGNSLYGGLAGASLYDGVASTVFARSFTVTICENYQRGEDAARRAFGLAEIADRVVPSRIFDQASKLHGLAHNPIIEYASKLSTLMRHPAIEYASKLNALGTAPATEYASKYPSNMVLGRPLAEYASKYPSNTVMGKPLTDYVSRGGGPEEPPSILVAKLDILVAEATSAVDDEPKLCSVTATPVGCKVDIEIRCAFCRGPIIAVSSTARWIGQQRLKFNADVVPLCMPCTQRDQIDPNYLHDALRALDPEPESEPSARPALLCLDGEGSVRCHAAG